MGLRFRRRRVSREKTRSASLPVGVLGIRGRIARRPLLLARKDLEHLPSREQTADLGAYVEGEHGPAVGLKAIVSLAQPEPGTLYVNFEDRSGRTRISHFLTEVEDLGWIAYPDGKEGSFRLLLQGIHGDQGCVTDLAWIEFSDGAYEEAEIGGIGDG